MSKISLDALDLAALLCSRVCHDVINPVGAIVNGLEMLEDEKDAEMREFALDLVKKSARTASARLQFCRIAFGAAGSAGASIDTGEAEKVAKGLFSEGKATIDWRVPRQFLPKNKAKLLLNMCLIANSAIPRGGVIEVAAHGEGDELSLSVIATGANPRVADGVANLIKRESESGAIESHSIQAYYAGLVAQAANLELDLTVEGDVVTLIARRSSDDAVSAAA